MGGIVLIKDEFVAWTGGKPNPFWTRLDPSAATAHVNPNQLCPTGVGSQQKSYRARTKPLVDKYKRGDSIKQFETKIWRKLEDYGLETISYVPDPQDGTKMVSVIKEHPRISLKHARSYLKKVMSGWDTYDKENDGAASTMVKESLDNDFAEGVEAMLPLPDQASPEDQTFIILWLQIMEESQILTDTW